MVHRGPDRQLELQLDREQRRLRPHPRLRRAGRSLRQAWSSRACSSSSRSALTITRAQSATRIVASGLGRRWGSQMAMCASARLNMQTTHFGLCGPRCATVRVAAGRACVMGPAWRSRAFVVWTASLCHAACKCCAWSGLQTSVGGLSHPGSCRLLEVQMVCRRTASGQGCATM